MSIDSWMDKEEWFIYTMEYYNMQPQKEVKYL